MKLLIYYLAEFLQQGDKRYIQEFHWLSRLIRDMKSSLGSQDWWFIALKGKKLSILGKQGRLHLITKPNFLFLQFNTLLFIVQQG